MAGSGAPPRAYGAFPRSLAPSVPANVDHARWSSLLAYHDAYHLSEEAKVLSHWNGDPTTCDPGSVPAAFHELVLRRINYFRQLAGLPTSVTLNEEKNQASQAAAMVMAREAALSHYPLQDFPQNPCVTEAIHTTAGLSNLALGSYGVDAIERLMLDDGVRNGPVGHRRWLLYSRAREMGHGSIPLTTAHPATAVIWVIGDFAPSAVPLTRPVTWPNEGHCPYHLAPNDEVGYPRWSISYPGADFSQAKVSMSFNGAPVSLSLEPLADDLGDPTLVWRPAGIPNTVPEPGRDHVAEIEVTGIKSAPFETYRYTVTLFDPFDLQQSLPLSGPETLLTGEEAFYHFPSLEGIDHYSLRVARQEASPIFEGAEDLENLHDRTHAAYSLQSASLSSEGRHSFHLLFPEYGEQSFEIATHFIPGAESALSFKRLFRFFYPHSKLSVEVTKNEGSSWEPLFQQAGTSSFGSSAEWDTSWKPVSIPIPPGYHGSSIRLRFRISTHGAFYQWPQGADPSHYGIFLDDITLTGSTQLFQEQETLLPGEASQFTLNEATAGQPLNPGEAYLIQIAPILGETQFPYSPPIKVRISGDSDLSHRERWLRKHFGAAAATEAHHPLEDPDADGLSNLLERALGGDPREPHASEAPSLFPRGRLLSSGEGTERTVLEFSLPKAPHADLLFEVQRSTNLRTWSTLAHKRGASPWETQAPEALIESVAEDMEKVTYQVSAPTSPTDSLPVILRLTVSSEEE